MNFKYRLMFHAWVNLKLITRNYGGGEQNVMLRKYTKTKMFSDFFPFGGHLFSYNQSWFSVFGLFLYANDFDFL